MDAKTAVKARLLDLTTAVLELVRDGNRDAEDVCRVFQGIKDSPNFLGQFFAQPTRVVDISSHLEDQQNFYKEFFGLELDFSSVRIPEKRTGFDRLIIVAQDLCCSLNRVYGVYEQNGIRCWRYHDDLDKAIDWDKEERSSQNGHYAIWVRNRVEADEELKNLSANDIKERSIKTETLMERMLHGLKYWNETKNRTDKDSITLCSGSRFRDGRVPRVYWHGLFGGVFVGGAHSGSAGGYLRSREVVS